MNGTITAKRTHARRSCELCKVRKTRCELPDIDVPSSTEALPVDKACHRCKVLALPCIVDDVARKPGKKRGRAEEGGEGEDGDAPVIRRPTKPRQSKAGKGKAGAASGSGTGDGVNHSLEVMHGIHPSLEWSGDNGEPALYSSDPFLKSSPLSSTFGASPMTNTMKLHGRPLELVCAMLRTAYSKSDIKDGRTALTMERINWAELVDVPMREKLEIGFAQLRTFHVYLDPLPSIFDKSSISLEPEDQLLLGTIIYLCTVPLAPTPPITKLRSFLRPRLTFLRDRILMRAPVNFTTLQALELLGVHAPLGVLPLQLTDPRFISVARGQLCLLQSISQQLKFHVFFKGISSKAVEDVWNLPDCLLFLAITALEASRALEDEVPTAPASLYDVRQIATTYLDESREYLWLNGRENIGAASLVGRLGLFDRICRLGEVLDSLDRLRSTLDTAAADTNFNPVDAISEEFSFFAQKMDGCDARHDAVLSIISPYSNNIKRGYITHRSMRRRYEHIKVLSGGLRCLLASLYIPGSRFALPSVPTDIAPHLRVSYAIDRATNPADIMPALNQNSLATMVIWQYGTHRGEICQQILNCLADLEAHVIPSSNPYPIATTPGQETLETLGDGTEPIVSAELIPLHECIVFAVDSAKMLMEARAGTLLLQKRNGNLHDATLAPIWVNSLKRACHTLRLIGLLSPASSRPDLERGPGQGETIANGCSNILGSMVRLTEEWGRVAEGPGNSTLQEVGLTKVEEEERRYGGEDQYHGQGVHGDIIPQEDGVDAFRRDQATQSIQSNHEQHQQQQHSSDALSDLLQQQQQQQQQHQHHQSPAMQPPSQSSYPAHHPFPSSMTSGDQVEAYPPTYPPLPPQQDAPPHGYMDRSDRWMAGGSGENEGNHEQYHPSNGAGSAGIDGAPDQYHHQQQQQQQQHPSNSHTAYPVPSVQQHHSGPGQNMPGGGPGGAGGSGHQGQGQYPPAPTALDLLLSQMFQYGPPPQ